MAEGHKTAEGDTDGISSAVNAPVRKRRSKSHQLTDLLHFNALPDRLRDNEYITKYYRANYNAKQTVRSLFGLHNETANIWSHLIGFMLFVALTVLTIYAQPAPLKLGAQKLALLEERVLAAGKAGWKELLRAVQNVEAELMESSSIIVVCPGAPSEGGLHAQELLRAEQSVEAGFWEKGGSVMRAGCRGLSRLKAKEGGCDTLLEDLQALEARVLAYGSEGLRGLEGRYAQLVAALSDAQWPTPRWPVHVFTAGAMTCLLTSSFCHLFGCCDWHWTKTRLWSLDYAGITVLIVSSFIPPIFYGFMCHPLLRDFYLYSTLSLGFATVCVSLLPFFQTRRFRTFRASLFAALGLWGIAPGLHAFLLYMDVPHVQRAFQLDLLMGAIYLLGAAIFALRVPERWNPGAFDLICSSHQLFHLCVVAAALVHYNGVHTLLAWRDATGGCSNL